MNQIPNRKERRAYMRRARILRKKSNLPLTEWLEAVRNNIKEGKNIHFAKVEENDKRVYEWYQEKENSIRNWLRETGKTEDEIKAHLDSWYESIK